MHAGSFTRRVMLRHRTPGPRRAWGTLACTACMLQLAWPLAAALTQEEHMQTARAEVSAVPERTAGSPCIHEGTNATQELKQQQVCFLFG